jgi:23S rRNA U2552 (ribose-2'-O)-methylase RlmE/FtsJ
MREVERAHQIALKAVYEHYALQKVDELTFLLALLEKTDVVVEIGCDAGGTSWAIRQMGVRKYIGIDMPGQAYSSGLMWQCQEKVDMVWGNSHNKETVVSLKDKLNGESIDVLIIDGDHTYVGVSDDFRDYAKLCNGLIVFHDICEHTQPDVKVSKYYHEICVRYPHTQYISDTDTSWGGIGVLDVSYARRLEDCLLGKSKADINGAITAKSTELKLKRHVKAEQ